jgi:tetratricopeptide (TPR) repeat protein
MRWLQTEYLLKGVYLGLLLFVALQKPAADQMALFALYPFGGLALALGLAGYLKLREGYRVRGRLFSFILFLLLENAYLVYGGIILGMAVGALQFQKEDNDWLLVGTVTGGVVLGLLFWYLEHVAKRKVRFWLSTALAVFLGGGMILLLQWPTWFGGDAPPGLPVFLGSDRTHFGVLLLLGIPLFYLLTFTGMAEESELEIGAMCAALFVGMWMIGQGQQYSPGSYITFAIFIPLLVYWVYSKRILPGLRVFKHVLRGLSYARIGQYRQALLRLKRALQLDPQHALARETLWSVHRDMDFDQIIHDPETLALVDFELCLERAGSLLLGTSGPPKPAQLHEAHRLLNFVAGQRPAMAPACDYWRAVASIHCREYDKAVAFLEPVLVPSAKAAANPHRRAILMSAWQVALTVPEMARRVGTPQLVQPGRRMEAIAAVERHLAANPDDPDGWNLKRVLYADLTEAEYEEAAGAPEKAAADFDHGYAQQLGLALVTDPARWTRGSEYLRIAARGIPELGPALFIQIAKAHERARDNQGAWDNYRRVKIAGRAAGPKNLSEEDRHAFFSVVKFLAEDAEERGDLDTAIDDNLLYREYERSGKETYRKLASLYEKKKDPWAALHATEQGLVYDSRDADLLEKKDRYYYSVTPDELRQRWENVAKYFDVNYCLQKSEWALKSSNGDLDMVDWAQHLADLAQAAQPGSLSARVLRARALLSRGEKDQAQAMLEEVRANKPEKFASGQDEDAWYTSCKILGNMYLHELNQPQRAVECFLDFRKSPKSGADTMFRLGQAYEELGDRARAVKCYSQVVAFESHPLAPDAHEALQRLKH